MAGRSRQIQIHAPSYDPAKKQHSQLPDLTNLPNFVAAPVDLTT